VKSEIIKETDKIFQKEKTKLMKEFKKEFDSELNLIKGETARLFANSIKGSEPGNLSNRFYWWIQCIKFYGAIDSGEALSRSVENALSALKGVMLKEVECRVFILESYPRTDECFFNIIENIPKLLHKEKAEIKSLTEKLLK
jgi:hypothetical protein